MKSPVVLELGSHSLKAHYAEDSGRIAALRLPWSFGHEVYDSGSTSERTLKEATRAVAMLRLRGVGRSSLLAIATGALRDADNSRQLTALISERMGVPIRVLTGREEASLLAEGYLRRGGKVPALLGDLGGGSLELVSIGARSRSVLRESLPLGAVRLLQLGASEEKTWNLELVERWVEDCFREEASVLLSDEVHATGGTVKAVSRTLGKKTFSPEELARLRERVIKRGPPSALDAPRQRVFLPGLIVLQALLRHSGAMALSYTNVSIGTTLLRRLLRSGLRSQPAAGQVLLKDMRLTNVFYPDDDEKSEPE